MGTTVGTISRGSRTKPATKRVLIRAERKDELEITDIDSYLQDISIPDVVSVVQRIITYYGPKLRVETADEQYLITAPGPNTQALLWQQNDSGWQKAAEIRLDFSGSLPQYDICPDCGEPLATIDHERQAAIGACQK